MPPEVAITTKVLTIRHNMLSIRSAIGEDALAIHELHTLSVRKICGEIYPQEIINGWLNGRTPEGYKGIANKEVFVIEESGKIMGFSHVVPGEIIAIFVHPDSVKKGIGSRLIRHATKKASENWYGPISVESTLNAESFYTLFGFKRIGKTSIRRNDVNIEIINMELKTELPRAEREINETSA